LDVSKSLLKRLKKSFNFVITLHFIIPPPLCIYALVISIPSFYITPVLLIKPQQERTKRNGIFFNTRKNILHTSRGHYAISSYVMFDVRKKLVRVSLFNDIFARKLMYSSESRLWSILDDWLRYTCIANVETRSHDSCSE